MTFLYSRTARYALQKDLAFMLQPPVKGSDHAKVLIRAGLSGHLKGVMAGFCGCRRCISCPAVEWSNECCCQCSCATSVPYLPGCLLCRGAHRFIPGCTSRSRGYIAIASLLAATCLDKKTGPGHKGTVMRTSWCLPLNSSSGPAVSQPRWCRTSHAWRCASASRLGYVSLFYRSRS